MGYCQDLLGLKFFNLTPVNVSLRRNRCIYRNPKDSETAPNSFFTKTNGKGFWYFGTDMRLKYPVFLPASLGRSRLSSKIGSRCCSLDHRELWLVKLAKFVKLNKCKKTYNTPFKVPAFLTMSQYHKAEKIRFYYMNW